MPNNELERIIQEAKAGRPTGVIAITWNPNNGQLNVQNQGDLTPPEVIYVIEIAKKLLLKQFTPDSPIAIPNKGLHS